MELHRLSTTFVRLPFTLKLLIQDGEAMNGRATLEDPSSLEKKESHATVDVRR